jgi:hypothetical protein
MTRWYGAVASTAPRQHRERKSTHPQRAISGILPKEWLKSTWHQPGGGASKSESVSFVYSSILFGVCVCSHSLVIPFLTIFHFRFVPWDPWLFLGHLCFLFHPFLFFVTLGAVRSVVCLCIFVKIKTSQELCLRRINFLPCVVYIVVVRR